MIQAQCLCGVIEFEAEELPGMVFNCHCSRCRRSHGAAFATQVLAEKRSLKFRKGEESLTRFEAPGITRAFCSHCGSRLLNYGTQGSEYLSVSLSAIANPENFRPIGECYAPKKLGFINLDPSLPHFEALPDLAGV